MTSVVKRGGCSTHKATRAICICMTVHHRVASTTGHTRNSSSRRRKVGCSQQQQGATLRSWQRRSSSSTSALRSSSSACDSPMRLSAAAFSVAASCREASTPASFSLAARTCATCSFCIGGGGKRGHGQARGISPCSLTAAPLHEPLSKECTKLAGSSTQEQRGMRHARQQRAREGRKGEGKRGEGAELGDTHMQRLNLCMQLLQLLRRLLPHECHATLLTGLRRAQ